MESRLEELKSKVQRVKSALRITSRTPMGNLLMMERLLSSFEEFERSQMVTTASHPLFFCQRCNNLRRNPFPRVRKKSMQKRKRKSLIRTFCLTVKIQPESSISTLKVRRMKIILFRPTRRCEAQKSTMAQYGGRCPLCGYPLELSSFGTVEHGHVALVSVGCEAGHSLRWNSNSIIGGKYTANLR